jgi:hypothetical protein
MGRSTVHYADNKTNNALKKIFIFLTLTVFIIITSCEKCGECFSPPSPFIFELVNEQGENIFSNQSFNKSQLNIEQISDKQKFEYQFISENDLNIIEIVSIGWTSEQVELSFQLDGVEVFTFCVSAERTSEDCCSFTRYNNIKLAGANFELDDQTGVYRVTVE